MSAPQRRLQRPAIFVCDLQEKFRNAIWEFDKIVFTATKLLRAAAALDIPIHTTTQNKARLGDTVADLQPFVTPSPSSPRAHPSVDKTRFSMWVPDVARHFNPAVDGPSEIVLVGIEAHICITQTALDLLAAGHKVYILADGVSSCNREEVGIALARLRTEGATITTCESFLYELMGDAAIPEFKTIVGLVKETGPQTKSTLQTLVSKI